MLAGGIDAREVAGRGLKFQEHPAPSPYIGDRRASLYVAASTIIMAHGSIFGPASIVLFYAMWLPRIRSNGRLAIRFGKNTALTIALAAWCCASAAWSQYPAKSIYSALEYTSLIACALIMASRVRMAPFLRGLVYGSSLTLLAALASGRFGVDPFSGKYSLVGQFGSKNVVGLFAELLVLGALILFPYTRGVLPRTLGCALPGLLGLACLHLSKSATSVISLVGATTLLAVLYAVTRMPRNGRLVTFFAVAAWLSAVSAAGYFLEWDRAVLEFFGKSTTLTGRTSLWDKGVAHGLESPVVGHGFASFWVVGHLPAEQLWYRYGIYGRVGFHFHNLYIQAFVDLGVVGAGLIAMILAQVMLKAATLILRHGMQLGYVAPAAFASMFAIRSFAEVDIMGTYGIGTMVFFALPPRLVAVPASGTRAPVPEPAAASLPRGERSPTPRWQGVDRP